MALRHNIKDDPWALAFGRSKLRQLRDTLFDDEPRDEHFTSRRYTINGRMIRVRIAGDEEYIWSKRIAAPIVGDWVLLATLTGNGSKWTIERGPLIAAEVFGYSLSNGNYWGIWFGNGTTYSPSEPLDPDTVVRVVDQATGEAIMYTGAWFGPDGSKINWELLLYDDNYSVGTVHEVYVRTELYGTYIWY